MKFKIGNSEFRTSSLSERNDRCVGVSLQENKVLVTNSKERLTIVAFTHDEWRAFVEGVKNCEFDLKGE